MKKIAPDLTGKVFGRWKVLGRGEDRFDNRGDRVKYWTCKCCCEKGTVRDVRGNQLNAGKSLSCGCISTENLVANNKKHKKKYNDYVILERCVIMYTAKNEPFLIDIEDFGKVYKYCWYKNKQGYFVSREYKKAIYLHRLIMNSPENKRIDHKRGEMSRYDNRKNNLRIATPSQNNMNKKLQSNNTSGYAGVGWHKDINRWVASITINGQYKHIGTFTDKNDAIKARLQAEEKYFGEWSYRNSQSLNSEGGKDNGIFNT